MARPGRPERERTRARAGAGRRQAAKGEMKAAAASAAEEAGGGGGEEKEGRKGAAKEATHRPCRPASPAWQRGWGALAARSGGTALLAGGGEEVGVSLRPAVRRAGGNHAWLSAPATGSARLYESSPVVGNG